VVIAHPSTDSFTHTIGAAAIAGLRAGGHEVRSIDLYAEGFRATMSLDERRAYETDDPLLDDQTRAHAALVRWADHLVFVYPTWWSGLPAILKGWLERVLVTGVAFRFDERTGKVRPALVDVRRIVGISTYGSPRRYVRAINDNGRRIVTRALWLACSPLTRRTWLALYSVDTATEAERRAFLDRVTTTMRGLR
jgi:NAD(P)H dehydrogenase (quinone)